MNSNELKKNIPIDKLLSSEGHKYTKSQHNGNTLWYLSPLVEEKTASFKIDIQKGLWYDFSQGVGGDIFDFIMKTKKVDFREAFKYLNDKFDKIIEVPTAPKKLSLKKSNSSSDKINIISSKQLENKYLLEYIKSRKIRIDLAKKYCREVYYQLESNDKILYAIGFINEKNGFELRNKYFKGNGKIKTFSYIDNKSKISCVFEGFFDFLSYITEFKENELKYNHIILNTNSYVKQLVRDTNLSKNSLYQKLILSDKLFLHFDNDSSGEDAKEIIKKFHKNCIDNSYLYRNFKDYNAKLIAS